MAAINMSIGSAMRMVTLEVRVTGARAMRARLWLGSQLMRLAALIIGCDIEVTSEATETDVIRYHPLDGSPVRTVFGRRIRSR